LPAFTEVLAEDLALAVLVALEEEELLEDVELASFCTVLPGTASAEVGASDISTLRARASQRVLDAAGLWGIGLGERATFIYPLYDGFGGQR
jgi:hypothetical protein